VKSFSFIILVLCLHTIFIGYVWYNHGVDSRNEEIVEMCDNFGTFTVDDRKYSCESI
jgi:hypothetical protein